MLGELLGGNPLDLDPAKQQETKSKWEGWLTNPVNQAGLISFGLQAMTGGWGNTGQQLAAALGAGFQGAAGQEKLQYTQEQAAEATAKADAKTARAEARQDRAADQRDRALDLQATRAGQAPARTSTVFNTVYKQMMKSLTDPLSDNPLDFDTAHETAVSAAETAASRAQGGISANAGAGRATRPLPRVTPGAKIEGKKAASNAATKGAFSTKLKDMSPEQIARVRAMAQDSNKRQLLEAAGVEIPTDDADLGSMGVP